jgi:integrase/recombinase XerC
MLPGERNHALPTLQQVSGVPPPYGLSNRSIQTLEIRWGELRSLSFSHKVKSIKDIKYEHLAAFAEEFSSRSIHVAKFRVWTLRQFYHFLSRHGYERMALHSSIE